MTDIDSNETVESEETNKTVEDNAGDQNAKASSAKSVTDLKDDDRVRALTGKIAKYDKQIAAGEEPSDDVKFVARLNKDEETKSPSTDDMRKLIREEAQALKAEEELSSLDLSDDQRKEFNKEKDELISRGYSAKEAVDRAIKYLNFAVDNKEKEERASRAGMPPVGKSAKRNFSAVSINDFQDMSQSERKTYMEQSKQKNGEVTFTS